MEGMSEGGGAAEVLSAQGKSGAVAVPRARVLVVDDEPRLLTTVRFILRDEHDVTILTSARAALERLIAGETFDVILCDLAMPDMSGDELFARLAAARPDMTRRVIFMTGGAITAAAAALLADDSTPRLEKPFRPADLMAVVRRAAA
jgi:CheY-like chemotaxis protein